MLVTGGTCRTPEGEPERDGDRGQQGLRQERARHEEGISRCTAGICLPNLPQPSRARVTRLGKFLTFGYFLLGYFLNFT